MQDSVASCLRLYAVWAILDVRYARRPCQHARLYFLIMKTVCKNFQEIRTSDISVRRLGTKHKLNESLEIFSPRLAVNLNVRTSRLLNTMSYLIITPAEHIHSALSQVNLSLQVWARPATWLPPQTLTPSFLGWDLGRRRVAGYTFFFSSRVRLWISIAESTLRSPFPVAGPWT